MRRLINDKNNIRISGLDTYAMETGLIVGINSLKITDSSLHYKRATEKESTVDKNGVETTRLTISRLRVNNSGLYYEKITKKGLIVDNNDIRTNGFRMSDLGEIGSSFCYNRHLQYQQSIFKGAPTCFYIKSSILL